MTFDWRGETLIHEACILRIVSFFPGAGNLARSFKDRGHQLGVRLQRRNSSKLYLRRTRKQSAFKIGGTPANAKTLVLIVDDPDAPSGLFTHWLVWNIDAKTSEVAANSVPAGSVEGTNDFAKRGYGAPCPPSKTHRYFFRVFALDRTLDLKAGAPRHELNAAMQGHIIAQGELMGRCTHR